ncbi:hypothetical protein PSEUDO9AG_40638 [Pseudomonas sp. 9Ag]|nr:hypothetical protein PSEUDO9AG_40638 [Pseudomonas sp. 9Ag]
MKLPGSMGFECKLQLGFFFVVLNFSGFLSSIALGLFELPLSIQFDRK